jgi:hypothetical protein
MEDIIKMKIVVRGMNNGHTNMPNTHNYIASSVNLICAIVLCHELKAFVVLQ